MSGGDLVAFLTARLDEDEAAARAAGGNTWREGCRSYDGETPWRDLDDYQGVSDAHHVVVTDDGGASRDQCRFIARFDPARVLADVAAKRSLMFLGQTVVRGLAQTYRDHPDYRAEWAL